MLGEIFLGQVLVVLVHSLVRLLLFGTYASPPDNTSRSYCLFLL